MNEFEKTVIGFFVAWSIAVPIFWIWSNVVLCETLRTLDECAYWLKKDYRAKFGYTECWKI